MTTGTKIESISAALGNRTVTREFTAEFLDNACDEPITLEDIERAAVRFERNYNAVAIVRKNAQSWGDRTGYSVTAIAASDADMDEVGRGMSALSYWLMYE